MSRMRILSRAPVRRSTGKSHWVPAGGLPLIGALGSTAIAGDMKLMLLIMKEGEVQLPAASFAVNHSPARLRCSMGPTFFRETLTTGGKSEH
jgi:hypothetical protein